MPKPSIAGTDFVRLDDFKVQTCCLLSGGPASGKTTFALRYAPQPIALINLDGRARERVKEEMRRGRDIHFMHLKAPKIKGSKVKVDSKTMKLCEQAIVKFESNYEKVLESTLKPNGPRSVAIDTGTEYDELLAYAFKGQLGAGKDYGKSKALINQKWRWIYDLAKEGNAHLIVLARQRERWFNNEPTGVMEHRGSAVMEEGADWAAQIAIRTKNNKVKGRVRLKFDGFEMTVAKAGNNIFEFGETYTDKDWGVEGLEAMIDEAEDEGDEEELERLIRLYDVCPDGPGPFVYAAMRQYPDVDYLEWV